MEASPSGIDPPPQKAVPRIASIGWRAMLIFNLGLAAFIFAKKREKDIDAGAKMVVKKGRHKGMKKIVENSEVALPDKEEAKPVPEHDPLFESTEPADRLVYQTVANEPVKVVRKPIPEDEQRELFKWILEEKRKIEPKDKNEKKRIDEEKAMLKRFILSERIPKFR